MRRLNPIHSELCPRGRAKEGEFFRARVGGSSFARPQTNFPRLLLGLRLQDRPSDSNLKLACAGRRAGLGHVVKNDLATTHHQALDAAK
jgi:hypothetical protein